MNSQVDASHCIMYMFSLLIITSLSTFLNTHVRARDVDFCFVDENDPYLYMSTKTAYHFVHGDRTRFQSVPSKYRITCKQ